MKVIKASLIIAFFIINVLPSAQAQYLRWGMKGGANISGFLGPDMPGQDDYGLGWTLGGYTDYRIRNHVSIWTEYNYMQRSVEFREEIKYLEGGHMIIDERNDFFTVPVFVKFRQENEIFNATAGFGISGSVLTRKARTIQVFIDDFPISTDPFYSSLPAWTDYGANAVGTIHFRAIFIDFQYYMSLRNIFQGEDAREMRYQTASVSLGYEFNHPEKFRHRRRRYGGKERLKYKLTHLFK